MKEDRVGFEDIKYPENYDKQLQYYQQQLMEKTQKEKMLQDQLNQKDLEIEQLKFQCQMNQSNQMNYQFNQNHVKFLFFRGH